jgi:hypothetical protein
MFRAKRPLHERFVATVEARLTRSGEGSGMRPWAPGDEANPRIPTGAVLHEKDFRLIGCADLSAGSYISVILGLRYLSGGIEGIDTKDTYGLLEILWDF